jgi:hypothetical protein
MPVYQVSRVTSLNVLDHDEVETLTCKAVFTLSAYLVDVAKPDTITDLDRFHRSANSPYYPGTFVAKDHPSMPIVFIGTTHPRVRDLHKGLVSTKFAVCGVRDNNAIL